MTSAVVDEYLGIPPLEGKSKQSLEKDVNVGVYIKKNIDFFL